MKVPYLYVILVLTLTFSQCSTKKCKALTMSGAGTMGAYQASVAKTMAQLLPKEDIDYDVLVGVSAGSINAAYLSSVDKEHPLEASQVILDRWNNTETNTTKSEWPGGKLEGLFFQRGLSPNQPSIDRAKKQWESMSITRKVSISTIDADNYEYKVWDFDETTGAPPNFIESVYASCAIPLMSPPVVIEGRNYIDAGTVWNLNVDSAVRRCREIADDDSDIIVDIIHVKQKKLDSVSSFEGYTAFDHFMRGKEINNFMTDTPSNFDYSVSQYPNVKFRYVIGPSEKLSTDLIPLDSGVEFFNKCVALGKKDAENAIKNMALSG